jgi:hypothetical protein
MNPQEESVSTELAAQQSGTDIADVDEAAVAAAGLAGLHDQSEDLVLPILKLTQQLSKEVTDEVANSGEFVNSLTGDNYGSDVELIIVAYFKGRFFAPKGEDQTYVARGEVAPSNWPDEYSGRRFDEIEDAEEQHKARANAEGGVWEPPLIQTTHNYIGLLPDAPDLPVRLSLKSSSTQAHRKIATLLRFAPGGRPWATVFKLRAVKRSKGNQSFYVVEAERGRETTPEEQQLAVNLATDYQRAAGSVKLVGEGDEAGEARKSVEASSTGGLDLT